MRKFVNTVKKRFFETAFRGKRRGGGAWRRSGLPVAAKCEYTQTKLSAAYGSKLELKDGTQVVTDGEVCTIGGSNEDRYYAIDVEELEQKIEKR